MPLWEFISLVSLEPARLDAKVLTVAVSSENVLNRGGSSVFHTVFLPLQQN